MTSLLKEIQNGLASNERIVGVPMSYSIPSQLKNFYALSGCKNCKCDSHVLNKYWLPVCPSKDIESKKDLTGFFEKLNRDVIFATASLQKDHSESIPYSISRELIYFPGMRVIYGLLANLNLELNATTLDSAPDLDKPICLEELIPGELVVKRNIPIFEDIHLSAYPSEDAMNRAYTEGILHPNGQISVSLICPNGKFIRPSYDSLIKSF